MLAMRHCQRQDDAVAYEFKQQLHSIQQPAAQQQIAALLEKIKRK
jgi:enoyl-CoA hydratase